MRGFISKVSNVVFEVSKAVYGVRNADFRLRKADFGMRKQVFEGFRGRKRFLWQAGVFLFFAGPLDFFPWNHSRIFCFCKVSPPPPKKNQIVAPLDIVIMVVIIQSYQTVDVNMVKFKSIQYAKVLSDALSHLLQSTTVAIHKSQRWDQVPRKRDHLPISFKCLTIMPNNPPPKKKNKRNRKGEWIINNGK